MTRANPSQAYRALETQILHILSSGRELRQFEIAAELQVPEHNDWTTHAALESMLKDELISFEWYHNILKDGSLSKIPYRFFRLTELGELCLPQPQPVGIVGKIRRILGF
jgi:hypothetical protein